MSKKDFFEAAAKKGCEVFIALNSGNTFIAKVDHLEEDGHVLFYEITGFDNKPANLLIHLSSIEAVGEVQTSGDDESAYEQV